jgi:excinuclease ABC subunit C
MVVWEDGKMKKSDYRRFIIRSLSGLPDDFQSMREVCHSTIQALAGESFLCRIWMLIDGGIGQLHAAQSSLDELNIVDQALASIAKTEELSTLPDAKTTRSNLERRSPVLRMIQQIRDESHRFCHHVPS